jgi:bacterioferritin
VESVFSRSYNGLEADIRPCIQKDLCSHEGEEVMGKQHYTEEAMRQAIEQGPITEEYKADRHQIIYELNRLRATEIASFLQYKQHAFMAVSLLSPGLKNDFEAHAATEMKHADMLAERVQQLGGVPIYEPAEIAAQASEMGVQPEQGPTLMDMVVEDLLLERQQVAAYTGLVREIGDTDLTTRRILMSILEETEQHASELADYLKRSAEVRHEHA